MKKLYSFLSFKTLSVPVIVLFLICSYWIVKNVSLSDLTGVSTNKNKLGLQEKGKEILNLEIRNGDIVNVLSRDLVKVVINHSDLKGVEKIISLSYSKTTDKMCFIAETTVPKLMFISNVDGSNLKEVDIAAKCEISPNGNYVSYINHVTDVSRTDVYLYNVNESTIVNLTGRVENIGYQRNYSDIIWVGDNSIEASYKDWLQSDYQTNISGVSIIDISTSVVSEKLN